MEKKAKIEQAAARIGSEHLGCPCNLWRSTGVVYDCVQVRHTPRRVSVKCSCATPVKEKVLRSRSYLLNHFTRGQKNGVFCEMP